MRESGNRLTDDSALQYNVAGNVYNGDLPMSKNFAVLKSSGSGRSSFYLATVISALLLALAAFSPQALSQATAYPNVPPLLLGAAWYPEAWDEATWDKDLATMEGGNIHLA